MVSSEFPVGAQAASGGIGVADPIVLFTALAIGMIIAGAAYYFGRRATEDAMWRAREDAATSIHRAILDKARTAAAATRPQVMAAAQALLDEIDKLLGPVAAISAFGAAVSRLKGGLEGKPAPEAKPADDHGSGHGSGHGGGDHPPGKDEHGHGKPGEPGEGSHPATRHSPSINISIGDVSHGGDHGKHDHKPAPGKGVDIDAIRTAVLAFTDYWSRPTMVAELRAAQRALVTPAPKSVLKPAASH